MAEKAGSVEAKRVKLKRALLKQKLSEGLSVIAAGHAPDQPTDMDFFRGMADSSTLGYSDEIGGFLGAASEKLADLTGDTGPSDKDILSNLSPEVRQKYESGELQLESFQDPEKSFGEYYDEYKGLQQGASQQAKEDSPWAYGAGNVAGYMLPGAAAGKAAKGLIGAKGAMASIGRAGIEGALIGGAHDTEGEFKDRIMNAAQGGAFGVGAGAMGEGLKALGKKALDASRGLRIKGTGAMLRDFKHIVDKKMIKPLDDFLRKNKIVTPGSTVKSVADKTAAIKARVGKRLGDLYDQAQAKLQDPKMLAGLTSKQQASLTKIGFDPSKSRDDILGAIKKELGNMPEASAALNKVDRYFKQLAETHKGPVNIKTLQDIKSSVGQSINWTRMNEGPASEKAMKMLYRQLGKKIDDQVQFLDDVLGGQGAKELKMLNKQYQYASQVMEMATDKVSREMRNNFFSLTERIAGIGGTVGGPIAAGPMGLIAGPAMALTARVMRDYGDAMGAGLLRGVVSPTAQGMGTVLRGAAPVGAGLLPK